MLYIIITMRLDDILSSWVTLSKKCCSILVFIITFQIINLYPSLARRLNEPLQRIDQPTEDFITSSSLSVSTDIPHLDITIDLARMSSLVYGFRTENAQNCSSFSSIYDDFILNESVTNDIPNSISSNYIYDCLMYERDDQDTQVLIVSRTTKTKFPFSHNKDDYIAVIFAGTDDFRNALTDSDLLTKHFGPTHDDTNRSYTFPSHEMNIRVHAGFNNAVFKHGLFDRIFDVVRDFKVRYKHAKILTTGHSLGASDSVLTAVALKIQTEFSNNDIHSINFGCPKTGNHKWKSFVNSIDGLGIWRVVNGIDLVPRLPGVRFHHVGHTVQLDNRSAKGYWLHEGNKTLGYAGVSFGWNSEFLCAITLF